MTKQQKQTFQRVVESWAKVFVAAVITAYMSGVVDWKTLVNAGLVAVLPVIFNWVNPKYEGYGRGQKAKTSKARVTRS
jgi:hypothetical protein